MTNKQPKNIEILENLLSNKGAAFTYAEREKLSIDGLLPDGVDNIDLQRTRVFEQLSSQINREVRSWSREI